MNYLRNAWYVASWSNEVKAGEMFTRTILEEPLVFYRKADGAAVALADRCPHRFIPLHLGKVKGDIVECCYHGLQFDCSGACVRNPHGDGRIPSQARVKSYQTFDKHGMLWIWMGDSPADPALIPDYSMLDEGSGYKTTRGKITIGANYELMGENLLDLSHVAFLHDGLLGSPRMSATMPKVREEGTAMYIDRPMPDVEVPAVFDMLYRQDGKDVDAWQNIAWFPPSCFLLDAGVCSVGGEREARGWLYGIHILTPETSKTTHYHFASATVKGGIELTDDDNRRLGEMRRIAFEDQDKPILDAQQAAIGDSDFWSQKPVLLSVDVGAIRMRRKLEQLIAAERGEQASTPATGSGVFA